MSKSELIKNKKAVITQILKEIRNSDYDTLADFESALELADSIIEELEELMPHKAYIDYAYDVKQRLDNAMGKLKKRM